LKILCNKTTYKKDSQKSGGLVRTSWTAAQHLDSVLKTAKQFSQQFLRRQLYCSPTDKKEKFPLRIFKNFFGKYTFGTFAFCRFIIFESGTAKNKRAKFSKHI